MKIRTNYRYVLLLVFSLAVPRFINGNQVAIKDSVKNDSLFHEFEKSGTIEKMGSAGELKCDDTTQKYYNEAVSAYYQYKRDEFHQANRVFRWQLNSCFLPLSDRQCL